MMAVMSVLAFVYEPGNLLLWVVAGIIGGWLAGQVSKGSGYGLIGDLVLGVVGALLLGFLLSLFFSGTTNDPLGFWGTVVAAFVGALLLTFLIHMFTGRRVVP